jgi:hypothetical protein
MQVFFIIWAGVACLADQTLPEGWWQQDSPENILTRAQTATANLPSLHGMQTKISNQEGYSAEFFQRKTIDGKVETKRAVYFHEKMQVCTYDLEAGTYFYSNDQLIKTEYPQNEQIVEPHAKTFIHPYDYKILNSEMIGTNDCVVVARIMTPEFLDVMKDVFYKKGYTVEQRALLGAPEDHIRSENDYYIRKNDAVVMGLLEKNNSGKTLDDYLYDVVQVNGPALDEEFVLPRIDAIVAPNSDEFSKIVIQRAKELKSLKGSVTEQKIKFKRYTVIGVMAASFGVMLIAMFIKFRHRTSKKEDSG